MAVIIPPNETTGMTCRIMDIETGIRFRTNGRKVTAPQVNDPKPAFNAGKKKKGEADWQSAQYKESKKIPHSTGERGIF